MKGLGWIISAIVGSSILVNKYVIKPAAEEQRRKNTPCNFVDGISQYEFNAIAKRAGEKIKRITEITTDGPIVYGTVQSQSGISEWHFKLDFNDYGHLTGTYWLYSDNNVSKIPGSVAEIISSAIKNNTNSSYEYAEAEEYSDQQKSGGRKYCSYCGEKIATNAMFCSYCGKKI